MLKNSYPAILALFFVSRPHAVRDVRWLRIVLVQTFFDPPERPQDLSPSGKPDDRHIQQSKRTLSKRRRAFASRYIPKYRSTRNAKRAGDSKKFQKPKNLVFSLWTSRLTIFLSRQIFRPTLTPSIINLLDGLRRHNSGKRYKRMAQKKTFFLNFPGQLSSLMSFFFLKLKELECLVF